MTSDSERIVGLYQRHARAWARDRGNRLVEQRWLDRFCGLMGDATSILDIGCGSGDPIARYLAGNGYKVTGADSAPEMIAMCREKFPNAEWLVADMRELALARAFGGLLAWDSFFHLCPEDQRRMFPMFGRHAAPGGALMFTSGPCFGEAIGSYRDEPLYHASLDATEYRALLRQNGFVVVAHVTDDRACGEHTIWLAQRSQNSGRR